MWLVVLAGAAISLLSSFYFPVEDFRVHAAQVSLLATLIGVVIFLIVALDRPFQGQLGLGPGAFELTYEQLMMH
jgi:ABC-type Co2+ transport system permease subunit